MKQTIHAVSWPNERSMQFCLHTQQLKFSWDQSLVAWWLRLSSLWPLSAYIWHFTYTVKVRLFTGSGLQYTMTYPVEYICYRFCRKNYRMHKQESPADADKSARRKTMPKIPPVRSYNKFQASRKSGVYSNQRCSTWYLVLVLEGQVLAAMWQVLLCFLIFWQHVLTVIECNARSYPESYMSSNITLLANHQAMSSRTGALQQLTKYLDMALPATLAV